MLIAIYSSEPQISKVNSDPGFNILADPRCHNLSSPMAANFRKAYYSSLGVQVVEAKSSVDIALQDDRLGRKSCTSSNI